MEIDFYNKYIKYKHKYIELKKQFGGKIKRRRNSTSNSTNKSEKTYINIDKHIEHTVSFVFTRDNFGVFYFALARKTLNDKSTSKSEDNYSGKWGGFEGNAETDVIALDAAIKKINEINGNIYQFNSKDVNRLENFEKQPKSFDLKNLESNLRFACRNDIGCTMKLNLILAV